MSIAAMVHGPIIKDAELKTSSGGKLYLLLLIKHEEAIIRTMLFGDDIEALQKLRKGDSVAATGQLTIGEWQGKPSLSLMAHRAISPSGKKPQRERQPAPSQGQYRAAAHAQRSLDSEIPDDLPWGE